MGRRWATRLSLLLGFRGAGFLDELDAERVEHLFEQGLFVLREVALGLALQHREDVDDFLGVREVGRLRRSSGADGLPEAVRFAQLRLLAFAGGPGDGELLLRSFRGNPQEVSAAFNAGNRRTRTGVSARAVLPRTARGFSSTKERAAR